MKKGIVALASFALLFGILKFFSFSKEDKQKSAMGIYNALLDKNYTPALEIPKNLDFSGEKMPLHLFDVRERLDKELIVNTYFQSQTLMLFKRANRWFPVIEPILKKNNVPDDFKYLALAESGLTNVISPAKAVGYWQLMTDAGEKYGLEINDEVDERYNVEKATEAACKYLTEAYQEFGNWTMAAAAYNMGIDGLQRQVKKQKVTSYYDLLLNEETSRYVFRLLTLKEIMSNPTKYGYKFKKSNLYPVIPTYIVPIDSSINDLAEFAIEKNINYKILKIFNPWLRGNSLTNKNHKKYKIRFPDPKFNYLRYIEQEEIIEEGDSAEVH